MTSPMLSKGAQRRMDEWLAMIGHEMRNPLGALNSALEVWAAVQGTPQEAEVLRSVMFRQIRLLTRLSNDLLDRIRIHKGELSIQCDGVSLTQVLEDACEAAKPSIDSRRHSLTVNIVDDQATVWGDSIRLLQVFVNLIQNAAKFTAPHGQIHIGAEVDRDNVIVRVRDNGQGIEPCQLIEVFEGAQCNSGGREGNDGLGIGLRLVKSIVAAHHGVVSVQSAGLGCGSEFVVQLPRHNAHVDNSMRSSRDVPTGQKGGLGASQHTLVIVDDDRLPLELLARMLRSLNANVFVARSGEKAIEIVRQTRPDAVILDLVMAEMDGFEIARRLREDSDLDRIPLIALSGYADARNKRRAELAGFDAYLVKPTSVAALREMLFGLAIQKDALTLYG